jgi:hypothetical protein
VAAARAMCAASAAAMLTARVRFFILDRPFPIEVERCGSPRKESAAGFASNVGARFNVSRQPNTAKSAVQMPDSKSSLTTPEQAFQRLDADVPVAVPKLGER